MLHLILPPEICNDSSDNGPTSSSFDGGELKMKVKAKSIDLAYFDTNAKPSRRS